jgi:hypothetical protein
MLLGPTRERAEGRAQFPDLEPAALRQVLRYLYTGRANVLEKEEGGEEERALAVVELLQAADKLPLPDLKVGSFFWH